MKLLQKIGHILFVILFWGSGFFGNKRLLWWHPTILFIIICKLIGSLIIGLFEGVEKWALDLKREKLRSY